MSNPSEPDPDIKEGKLRGNWLLGILILLSIASASMWFIRSQGWMDISPTAFWAVAHTTTVLVVIYLFILYRQK